MHETHQKAELAHALEEWKIAENVLDYAQDPDLVEYAVFHLEAAKRRYDYLLRMMKQEEANSPKEA